MRKFGPQNENEAEIFAVEELRAEIQYEVLRALKQNKMSQAELARHLGCSPAAVSQFLDDDANLTLETVARIFLAMDRQLKVTSSPRSAHFTETVTPNIWAQDPVELKATPASQDTVEMFMALAKGSVILNRKHGSNDNGDFYAQDLEQVA